MTPRPGMRYVRPDGSGARVVMLPDGLWLLVESTGLLVGLNAVSGYALDLSDGATLGAVEHDLLAPAGLWVERSRSHEYRARREADGPTRPWRCSLSEALRDALEVIDG